MLLSYDLCLELLSFRIAQGANRIKKPSWTFRGSSVSVFTNKVVSGVMFTNKGVGFGGDQAFRGLFGLSAVSGIVFFIGV